VTLLLPEAYLEGLDELVRMGLYQSRSAAIRFAVMDLLKRELWRQGGLLPENTVESRGNHQPYREKTNIKKSTRRTKARKRRARR